MINIGKRTNVWRRKRRKRKQMRMDLWKRNVWRRKKGIGKMEEDKEVEEEEEGVGGEALSKAAIHSFESLAGGHGCGRGEGLWALMWGGGGCALKNRRRRKRKKKK